MFHSYIPLSKFLENQVFCRFHTWPECVKPLSSNPTKCLNTLKQFVGNCLSMFNHFVMLVLKGLNTVKKVDNVKYPISGISQCLTPKQVGDSFQL